MTTHLAMLTIAQGLLQILDKEGASYKAEELPSLLESRLSGSLKATHGSVRSELTRLKKMGLVFWEAEKGRRPWDYRGARWRITDTGRFMAKVQREVWCAAMSQRERSLGKIKK